MDKLTYKGSRRKALIFLLIIALAGFLYAVAGGAIVERSFGATATQQTAQAITRCASTSDRACKNTRKAKRFKRKFNRGDLGHSNGFSHKRMYKKPARARKVIVRRLARMIRAARSAGTAREQVASGGYRLQARAAYYSLMKSSERACEDVRTAREYYTGGPGIPSHCYGGYDLSKFSKISMETLLKGLVVTSCYGGVAVAILTPAGRAASTALKFWGAGFGFTGCTAGGLLAGLYN